MRRAIEAAAKGAWPEAEAVAAVTLDYDARHRRRIRLDAVEGGPVLLDLHHAVALREGDGLRIEEGGWIAVHAAAEDLVEVRARDAHELNRFAWHLGNRHCPAEIALESRSQGEAFLAATRNAWRAPPLEQLGGSAVYPVAVGLACAAHGIALDDGLGAYFHAFTANLVSAGVRLIPLGQSQGQAALAALESAVARAADRAQTTAIEDMGSAAPLLDLASMDHETQYSRLFRS